MLDVSTITQDNVPSSSIAIQACKQSQQRLLEGNDLTTNDERYDIRDETLSPNAQMTDTSSSASESSKSSAKANDESPPLGTLLDTTPSKLESPSESSPTAIDETPLDDEVQSSSSSVSGSSISSSSLMPVATSSPLFGELLDLLAKPLEGRKGALILMAGAQLGLFYETLAIVAVSAVQTRSGASILSSHYSETSQDENSNDFQRYSRLLSNLSAFMYWDFSFNYGWKFRNAKSAFKKYTFARQRRVQSNLAEWTSDVEKENMYWCELGGINATLVKEVSDIMESCIQVVFQVRFASEAEWLQSNKPFPLWKRTTFWRGKMQIGESTESLRDNMILRVYGEEGASRLCDALCALLEGEGDTQTALMYALEVNEEEWQPCHIDTEQKQPSASRLVGIKKRVQNTRIGTRVGTVGRRVRTWRNNRKERRQSRLNSLQGQRGTNGEFEFDLENFHAFEAEEQETDDIPEKRPEFRTVAPHIFSLRVGSEGNGFSWCCDNAGSLMAIGNNLEWLDELFFRGNPPHIVAGMRGRYQPPTVSLGRRRRKSIIIKNVWPAEVHIHDRLQSLCAVDEIKHVVWKVPKSLAQGGKQSMMKTFLSISSLLDQAMLESLQDSFVCPESIQLGLWINDDNFSNWSVLPAAHLSGWNLVGWSLFDDSCSTPKQQELGDQHFYVFQYDAGYG